MSEERIGLDYRPPDKIVQSFHHSRKPVAGIRAARGTGKTTSCLMELAVQADQMPPQKDGVRRSRFLITRTVYGDLFDTAVKSYKERCEPLSNMFLPITHREPWYGGMKYKKPDGTSVESEWVFKAFAQDDLGKLASDQYTGAYINEIIDWSTPDVISNVMGSCSRYPTKDNFSKAYLERCEKEGKPPYTGRIIFDTNGPYESHWLRKIEDEPPSTLELFVQEAPLLISENGPPPGVMQYVTHKGKTYYPNPAARFAHIQPKGFQYWLDLVPTSEDWYIESRILGQYAKSVSGKVVYGEFNDAEHISKGPLSHTMAAGKQVICGIDTSGKHPAACWTFMSGGTLYVLEEAQAQDIAYEQFIDEIVAPIHAAKFMSADVTYVLDPSNPESGIDKRTALQVTIQRGLKSKLARTNKFGDRRDAVKRLLTRRNGFLSSSGNTVLNAGFRGHYKYKDVRGKPGIYTDMPDKSVIHADMHDALQYAALEYTGNVNEERAPKMRINFKKLRGA